MTHDKQKKTRSGKEEITVTDNNVFKLSWLESYFHQTLEAFLKITI